MKIGEFVDWFNPWSKEHKGNIDRFSTDLTAGQRILTGVVTALATILLLGFGGVGVFRLFTEKVFKKVDLDKGTDSVTQLANRVNQIVGANADLINVITYELTETEVRSLNRDSIWDKIHEENADRLVIQLDNGDTVTYEKLVLERLAYIKPSIEDLVEKCTLKFASGEELSEARAKLYLCGDLFTNLIAGASKSDEIPLRITLVGFRTIIEALDMDEYSSLDLDAVKYLLFPPASFLPEGIYGQKEWDKWGDVGIVPPPPLELLTFMETGCPISNDGRLAKDTHVIMWIPATIDGKTPTLDDIEAITNSEEKFGDRKIGYDYINKLLSSNLEVNRPIVKGYWIAMYKEPLEGGKSYADQQAYIANSCPEYEVPTVRDVIFCSLMNYICSGEYILAEGKPVCYTRCQEKIYTCQIIIGVFGPAGPYVYYSEIHERLSIGICPVRKFFGK